MAVLLLGLKLKLGGICTFVAASAGDCNVSPDAPDAKTLNPKGMVAISEPVVTFTSLAPTVAPAPAAMVTGTVIDVALL